MCYLLLLYILVREPSILFRRMNGLKRLSSEQDYLGYSSEKCIIFCYFIALEYTIYTAHMNLFSSYPF